MDGKLVLARKQNEGVTLTLPTGEKVHVAVDIKGSNQVALIFDAPKNVEINRDEIEKRKMDGVPFEKPDKPKKTPKIMHKKPRSRNLTNR